MHEASNGLLVVKSTLNWKWISPNFVEKAGFTLLTGDPGQGVKGGVEWFCRIAIFSIQARRFLCLYYELIKIAVCVSVREGTNLMSVSREQTVRLALAISFSLAL